MRSFANSFAAYRNVESVVDREDSNPDASSDGGPVHADDGTPRQIETEAQQGR